MVTCDSLNIIISCLSVSADAGSASLNIPPLKKKTTQFFVLPPLKTFLTFSLLLQIIPQALLHS